MTAAVWFQSVQLPSCKGWPVTAVGSWLPPADILISTSITVAWPGTLAEEYNVCLFQEHLSGEHTWWCATVPQWRHLCWCVDVAGLICLLRVLNTRPCRLYSVEYNRVPVPRAFQWWAHMIMSYSTLMKTFVLILNHQRHRCGRFAFWYAC